jgi:threonine dehydrogenase-like Zn-dependent dehydrogenase
MPVRAAGVFPSKRELRLVDHPEPRLSAPDQALVRMLEVGVCGTDREICSFAFGEPPAGSDYFVLGHEGLGEVVEAGPEAKGLRRGDLVVPMVRLPCSDAACASCGTGRQDFCLTDSFPEHGIRRAHGFMVERTVEPARFLVPVPARLRDVAVLVEPLTIAEKALFQVEAVQKRLPYPRKPGRALVVGAGPVGLVAAMAFLVRGYEVVVTARSPGDTPNARLAAAIGASYVSGRETPPEALARKLGQIDLIYEAAGSVQAAFAAMESLGTNGVCVLTGVPALQPRIPANVELIMRNVVLRNQALVGTVNAGRDAFEAAIRDLGAFLDRWPAALRGLVTGRHRLEDFRELVLGRPSGIKDVIAL